MLKIFQFSDILYLSILLNVPKQKWQNSAVNSCGANLE